MINRALKRFGKEIPHPMVVNQQLLQVKVNEGMLLSDWKMRPNRGKENH